MKDDQDLEIVELDAALDGRREEEAYAPGRLVTVAGVGALLSLGLYYVYQQLDEDKRTSLRRKASGLVADQFQRLTDVEE